MNVVLLANENPRATIACLRSLRKKKANVYLATTKSKNIFSYYTSYKNPTPVTLIYSKKSSEQFYESLLHFKKLIGSYILFPSGEQIMRWAVRDKYKLSEQGIILPTVDIETYEKISDKHSFVSLCMKHGLDAPEEIEKTPDIFTEKFVIKSIKGLWNDTRVLPNPVLVENNEALQVLKKMDIKWEQHFAQKYIIGDSYYYCSLYNKGEKLLCMTQKTLAQQPGGNSVIKAALASLDSDVIDKIDNMMASLQWQGVMMFELKKSDNKHYAIECNPRLWGPLQLAVDNDFNFPYVLWQLASGKPVTIAESSGCNIGYRWSLGYLSGLLQKYSTKTNFQFSKIESEKKIVFKDIWLRRDTFFYFIKEAFSISITVCITLIKTVFSLNGE